MFWGKGPHPLFFVGAPHPLANTQTWFTKFGTISVCLYILERGGPEDMLSQKNRVRGRQREGDREREGGRGSTLKGFCSRPLQRRQWHEFLQSVNHLLQNLSGETSLTRDPAATESSGAEIVLQVLIPNHDGVQMMGLVKAAWTVSLFRDGNSQRLHSVL